METSPLFPLRQLQLRLKILNIIKTPIKENLSIVKMKAILLIFGLKRLNSGILNHMMILALNHIIKKPMTILKNKLLEKIPF